MYSLPCIGHSLASRCAVGAIAMLVALPLTAFGQDDKRPDAADAKPSLRSDDEPRSLKFAFRHAPWEEVLEWLAEEADLSFSTEVMPTGTFNYIDESQTFSAGEAIDLVNSYLLIKGYTLVRKGKMLIVIDLEDDLDAQLVRDLLTETPLKELDSRGEYEITKTRFNLKNADAEAAKTQITELLSPVGSIVVMPGAKQILATETGGTLRMIREIIASLEQTAAEMEKGKLHAFHLKIATADEVLIVARPLLGIEEEQFADEDATIRISADALGRTVFATGEAEKVKLVEQIIEQVDSQTSTTQGGAALEAQQFMSHKIANSNAEAVLRVLQTLFVGDLMIRLDVDQSTGSIIAFAKPSQHRAIKATIAEMEQNPERVVVIPLRTTDPEGAAMLIEKLFSTSQKPPIVDGTIIPPQLVVRGTQPQIEQIRSLLADMGEEGGAQTSAFGPGLARTPRSGNIRLIPMTPEAAVSTIEQIQRIWPGLRENEIKVIAPRRQDALRTFPPSAPSESRRPLRPRDGASDRRRPARQGPRRRPQDRDSEQPAASEDREANRNEEAEDFTRGVGADVQTRLVSDTDLAVNNAPSDVVPGTVAPNDDLAQADPTNEATAAPAEDSPGPQVAAEIVVSPTPEGLMISSKDEDALNAIQTLIEAFTMSGMQSGPRFNLFYLKHVEAETARTLLESVLTGLSTTATTVSSTSTDGRTGLVGNLQQGSTTSLGLPHMVSDKRLNALFVQGEPSQIAMVKQLLDVIDIESGPEEVLTFPRPRFIPVYNTSAESVAQVIREVYANRIETGENNNRRGENQNNDDRRGRFGGGFFGRGGGRNGGDERGREQGQQSAGDLPKMTVGVDLETNALVVSAAGPLLTEVESVVRELDRRAGQRPPETVRVYNLKRTDALTVSATLSNILGEMVETTGSTSSNRANTGQNRPAGPPATPGGAGADILNQMRQGGFPPGGEFRGRGGGERGAARGRGGGEGGFRGRGGDAGGGGARRGRDN